MTTKFLRYYQSRIRHKTTCDHNLTIQADNTEISFAEWHEVNLIPMVYVLFFDWKVFILIALYWAENIIIGIMNVAKMITVKVKNKVGEREWLAFMFHYGFFALVHGVFVFDLFGPDLTMDQSDGTFLQLSWLLEQRLFLIGLAALFFHHFASYLTMAGRKTRLRNRYPG